MMDDKIIFKPEKGTASYNPLIDNIEDTNTQEAFAGAKRFASVLGMEHVRSIGLILFVRFSKAIPKKDKTLARLKEILKSGISFKTVSDIGCVKDSGQDWYEMDALICTFLTAEISIFYDQITEIKTGKILNAAELKQFLKAEESN